MTNRLPYEKIDRNKIIYNKLLNTASKFIGRIRAETIAKKVGIDALRSWFFFALLEQNNWFLGNLTYYEFGVGWGSSLLKEIYALRSFCKYAKKNFYDNDIYLFDSFQGLPPKLDPRDDNPEWGHNVFAHGEQEIRELLLKHNVDLNKGNVHFIKGYYQETLTPELRKKIKKPSIITIDVDYYSSTKTVLEWLRPILSDGVLFYFDDIWSFHGDPNRGELAAINDFNRSNDGYLVPYHAIGHPSIWPHIYAYVPAIIARDYKNLK